MTAVWEMRLDEVVTGRVHFKGVIDEIAAEAEKLIAVLRQHTGALVDLSRPAAIAVRRGRGRGRTNRNADKAATDMRSISNR
jgi:DNA topoisomerase-3